MISKEQIQQWIQEGLPGAEVVVRGDDGAHFEAEVAYAGFEGKSMVQQHQMVYATLGDRVTSGELHALGLKTYTPDEWARR